MYKVESKSHSITLHTPLWSSDILRKGALAKLSGDRWSHWMHRGVLVRLPRYFIPLSRTQCSVVVAVCLEIAINLQTDCRSIFPLIFHPTWPTGTWCWQGQTWEMAVPFPGHTTWHSDGPNSAVGYSKSLMCPFRRGISSHQHRKPDPWNNAEASEAKY